MCLFDTSIYLVVWMDTVEGYFFYSFVHTDCWLIDWLFILEGWMIVQLIHSNELDGFWIH